MKMSSGRRYFRLLKWYPCWEIAWEKILAGSSSNGSGGSAAGSAAGRGREGGKGESTTLRQMLEGMKYAFLGMYFFLEMLTIVRTFSLFFFLLLSLFPPRLPSLPPLSPKMSQYTYTSNHPPSKKKKKIHKLTPVTIQKISPRKKRPMPSE